MKNKIIHWAIRKIKQLKISLSFESKNTKIRKNIFSFSSYRKGFKTSINLSLAFKSDWSGEAQNDLYLKGQGHDVKGLQINFDEKIQGQGHTTAGGEHRWKLTVFESGTTRLGEIGGGDGAHYGEDEINCDVKRIFEKSGAENWMGGGDQWEEAVASVKFKLTDCKDKSRGRQECNIEIADFERAKNKNYSSFKNQLGVAIKDLYLKGLGYDAEGKPINFDEKITGSGHTSGEGEYRWKLRVFKSGTTQLGEIGGGDGDYYGDDDIKCPNGSFHWDGKTGGVGISWEKATTDIPYYLVSTDTVLKREIFEIKRI